MPVKTLATVALIVCLVGCKSTGTRAEAAPDPSGANTTTAATRARVGTSPGQVGVGTPLRAAPGHELAVFAAGCFWGVEDTFRQVPGVVATAVGYTGGTTDKPTYEQVCTHTTGHAEAVLIEYEPSKITYEELVRVFFKNHDPTTLNRQGPDVGSQYRSAVFTFDDKQAEVVSRLRGAEEKERGAKVVTVASPLTVFWKAEEYHQQYDEKTGTHSCPLPKGLPKQK